VALLRRVSVGWSPPHERHAQTLRFRPGRRARRAEHERPAAEDQGLQQALTQALSAVNQSQNEATDLQREVQLDNPTVSLEQTMVSMQKAQISFAATLQVRNKLVQAYSDIMGMQV
jgi:flagellar hook-basal body complex protein FliE